MDADQLKKFNTLKQYIEESKIDMVDLKFVDLSGKFRHVTIPSEGFTVELVEKGVGFDGSSVGFKSVKSGDMCLLPDLKAYYDDPFWDQEVLSLFCNIAEADTRTHFVGDPRSVAIRALEYLRQEGIAEDLQVLPELEFNIFDTIEFRDTPYNSGYNLECREPMLKALKPEFSNNGYWIHHQSGYHAAAPFDAFRNVRSEIVQIAEKMGIRVKYHHHEVGATGQQEIELTLNSMVESCDHALLLKYIVKNVASEYGLTATFMPKPIRGESGNGMHMHFRLIGKNQEALFYDDHDDYGLSDLAYCFIGGVLEHGKSLAAFTNPSTNSFRRLIRGYEAPTNLFFSIGSRNSAIRIPKYANQPESKRFEIRSPDATCNMYFATAAILMAGIDGIKRGIHAKENFWGPFNDMASIPSRQRKRIMTLPESLYEALEALRKDHEYLLRNEVFSDSLVFGWIKSKMDNEVTPMMQSPTPLEYTLYYGC